MPIVSSRDHRRILDFLVVAYGHVGDGPFPSEVLDELRSLVPCEIAAYREARDHHFVESVSGVDPGEARATWARYPLYRSQDPLPGVCERPGRRPAVRVGVAARFSDVVSMPALRRSAFFEEICRPLGTRHVLKLFVPMEGGVAGFVLESGSRDFSVRDREVLSAMATHLGLVRTVRAAGGTTEPNGALEALTRREREVVDRVVAGLTNREIGESLFISPGTVRKHLDNVYAKLDVRTRAAVVAVALGGGLPAAPKAGSAATREAGRRGSARALDE